MKYLIYRFWIYGNQRYTLWLLMGFRLYNFKFDSDNDSQSIVNYEFVKLNKNAAKHSFILLWEPKIALYVIKPEKNWTIQIFYYRYKYYQLLSVSFSILDLNCLS